ncbi:biosynthesis C-methyltransferase UbiE [Seminavis robusta]|uniref:2-methoxy-6-polyprenyl-1,4-benzoquinol methylase, mitochondrial n=1 Tax=Seminavis robusta TaxID=568900 RepID=A0A9N8DM17_9STRA|nr:biosynthesis C-methyltransferase UbiE [Seminavis robusta]|eukprot:Sro154_g069990.1 biosynthesis C-methyltransferase UbiE (333) ;mRNA; f:38181-39179
MQRVAGKILVNSRPWRPLGTCSRLLQLEPPRSSFSTATPSDSSSNNNDTQQQQQQSQQQSTHFGFQDVRLEDKEHMVRGVFDSVAESYDVMNDLMSAGIHRVWKDTFVACTRVESLAKAIRCNAEELTILDVAGGTGDIAFRMVDAMGCEERAKSSGRDPVSVTVCDINTEMLRVGQRRARERYGAALLDETQALSFQEGNAQSLTQLEDNSFDLYTIAFGLRNVTDVDAALREARRVLKPGGRFMCLEFSHLPHPVLQSLYDVYSFNVIPTLGEAVANDRASYQYLVESIRKFSDQETLVKRMTEAGMEGARYTNLTGGIVAIHEGWKPLE